MAQRPIDRLLAIMAQLRDKERGCPWDIKQNFTTIAPYTIEEAYEVADAIERGDIAALKDELGDLLLQVVFHARMAEEAGHFAFGDVVEAIADKMVRRHPHVFGDGEIGSVAAQNEAWEAHKAAERAAKGEVESVLDGVTLALPALLRAAKISRRAARIGFDWPDAASVIPKIAEEIGEIEAACADGAAPEALEEEVGDLLFAAANLARKLDVEPETALRRATTKFERRFRQVEALARERGIGNDLDALEGLWREIKQAERTLIRAPDAVIPDMSKQWPFKVMCCFCGKGVEQEYPDSCTVIVSTVNEGEWQQWYCHAECLRERLAEVPRAELRLF
jgi:MazG family protein